MLEAFSSVFNETAFVTAFNVFILFVLVGYIGGPMATGMLSKRKNAIIEEKEKAKTDMEEAKRLRLEYEEKLAKIQDETENILSQARDTAKLRDKNMQESAKAEAERIVNRAEVEAQLEKKRVNDEIKQEIIDKSSIVAREVIKREVDEKINDELIEETLKKMGEDVWQS